ncbi:DUF6385 domain-containing protein [Kyrpidia sp.]|uniref:DUF6385 domain-containing protein n=1 Tax=Kyrpidia sp. TaxID=2073077 RepID=UPI00258C6B81|nr:DUF6385 domain-containing protein [Kyrpidia sp.]MCL6577583.1 DUF6385 domain-containing protein [Kyrpidia sp.]
MFHQSIETYTTTDNLQGSNFIELAGLEIYTFVVINSGTNPATVALQVSPDQGTFLTDSLFTDLIPQSAVALVPRLFLRYARIVFRSTTPGRPTTITIVFNGQ